MAASQKVGSELASAPASFGESQGQLETGKGLLPWRVSERIEWYVAVGHDLVSRSPLGRQLECMRDNVKTVGLPTSDPSWDVDFTARSESARAVSVARWLVRAGARMPVAVPIAWSYCHPVSVALDGLPGGRGRLLACYAFTGTGSRARLSAGGSKGTGEGSLCRLDTERIMALRGARAHDALRQLYADAAQSKGHLRLIWNRMHREARAMVVQAAEVLVATESEE
jgi:hypothetical protein